MTEHEAETMLKTLEEKTFNNLVYSIIDSQFNGDHDAFDKWAYDNPEKSNALVQKIQQEAEECVLNFVEETYAK